MMLMMMVVMLLLLLPLDDALLSVRVCVILFYEEKNKHKTQKLFSFFRLLITAVDELFVVQKQSKIIIKNPTNSRKKTAAMESKIDGNVVFLLCAK